MISFNVLSTLKLEELSSAVKLLGIQVPNDSLSTANWDPQFLDVVHAFRVYFRQKIPLFLDTSRAILL